jgi:hypothetical protein
VFTSKGNKLAFPDVVGNGKDFLYGDAESELNGQGYSQVSEVCVTLPPATPIDDPRIDHVSASDPAPGTYVLPNAKVKLTVTKLVCP